MGYDENQSSRRVQAKLETISNERFIHYDLERFQTALKAVGNPEKTVKTLIIAGTNGKGTTTLLVTSAIMATGAKVGTYLSPHLQAPNERLLYNLTPINDAEFESLIDEMMPTANKYRLTYFEFLTLLAFVWARKRELDFLVLEVGLGGRLDATNVSDPIASLITNIDWDHQAYLGNSLEEIFNEKFAVVRPESLCFSGIKQRSLNDTLIKRCDEIDTIYYMASELRVGDVKRDWFGQTLSINGHPFSLTCPTPGAVQSAMMAFLAARIVFPKLSLEGLQEAFARVKNPGRFEVVQQDPMVVLSGDHNPAGIECLEQTLADLPRKGKLKILCAFSPDKPFAAMFEKLSKLADEIVLTVVPRLRESMPAEYFKMAKVVENPIEAVEQLILRSSKDDVILVTGSLYLVGEVRALWKKEASFLTTPRLNPRQSADRRGDASPAILPPVETERKSDPASRDAAR